MKIIILISLFFCSKCLYSQDDFNYLFPVQPNVTRFEARKILNQSNHISVVNDYTNYCNWNKIDYLKNDSAYRCILQFSFINNKFFTGYENSCLLRFADDKLYSIKYEIKYRSSDYQLLLEEMKGLRNIIALKFPDYHESLISTTNKDGGKEQIGIGYVYFIKSEEQEDNKKYGQKFQKYRKIDINYTNDYKLIWKEPVSNSQRTGEIESYIIEIEFTDLRNVKYDTRGY